MKNVILTGASGMIGGLILETCLASSDVRRVTSIVRKPTGAKHPKLTEVVHQDFLDFSAVESTFDSQDICFYCVGVYTGQVPTDEFKKITVDFTRAFAEALHRHSPEAAFCFLSGQGADSKQQSRILFAREKGIAENILLSLKFGRTHLFRPGYIYPETPRTEPNFAYRAMRVLWKPLAWVYPNAGVTSGKLATKMVEVGLHGGDLTVYENHHIRA